MSAAATIQTTARKQGSPLLYFLMFISCVFIGILIFAYMVTKRTHPIYVDEQGRPTNAQTTDQPVEHNPSK